MQAKERKIKTDCKTRKRILLFMRTNGLRMSLNDIGVRQQSFFFAFIRFILLTHWIQIFLSLHLHKELNMNFVKKKNRYCTNRFGTGVI